jgi:hypothetical protein
VLHDCTYFLLFLLFFALPLPFLLLLQLFHYSLIQICKYYENNGMILLAISYDPCYTPYSLELYCGKISFWIKWDDETDTIYEGFSFSPCSVKALGSFLFLSASNLFWTCSQKILSENK